jgi:hypothetical protein
MGTQVIPYDNLKHIGETGENEIESWNMDKEEINPSVYSLAEFESKLKRKHHFLGSVLEDEYILLIGNEDELRRMASKYKRL